MQNKTILNAVLQHKVKTDMAGFKKTTGGIYFDSG